MTKEEISIFPFTHSCPAQIRYNDVDVSGHVNNGMYHSYFDIGRHAYFHDMFQSDSFGEGRSVVLAQVNTTYVKEVKLHDTLEVKSSVSRWGNSSFDMIQAIFRDKEGEKELVTYNLSTFVSLYNGKPSPIPNDWKEKVAYLEKKK